LSIENGGRKVNKTGSLGHFRTRPYGGKWPAEKAHRARHWVVEAPGFKPARKVSKMNGLWFPGPPETGTAAAAKPGTCSSPNTVGIGCANQRPCEESRTKNCVPLMSRVAAAESSPGRKPGVRGNTDSTSFLPKAGAQPLAAERHTKGIFSGAVSAFDSQIC
jgi:hypothetical protein